MEEQAKQREKASLLNIMSALLAVFGIYSPLTASWPGKPGHSFDWFWDLFWVLPWMLIWLLYASPIIIVVMLVFIKSRLVRNASGVSLEEAI